MSSKAMVTPQNKKSIFIKLVQSQYFYPLLALVLLLLFNLLTNPTFFQIEIKNDHLYGSLIDILNRAAPVALLSIGMTLVIATGGIDLSVGSVMAISGAFCAYLISNHIIENTLLIILCGMGIAMLCGLWNGLLVSLLGIQPFVATLILMVAGRGIAQLISKGQILTFNHAGFEFIGGGFLFGIPFPIIIVIIAFIITLIVLKVTALGLFIASIGANPIASNYVGIREPLIKILVYVFSGLCAGIAGMILTSDISGADANNIGLWSELDAILAVVIGGTSLMGGRYFLGITLIGVIILQTLTTMILTQGLPVQFTHIVKSIVVILVMLLMSTQFRNELKAIVARKGEK